MSCCNTKTIQPKCCGEAELDEVEGDFLGGFVWRIGLALVLAGQSMVFGIGINLSGPVYGSLPYWFVHGGLFAGALMVIALLGFPLIRDTSKALYSGRLTLEGLFALSMVGALGGSLVSSLTGEGSVYYEVVAIVLIIYRVGKHLGKRSRRKAQVELGKIRQVFDYAYLRDDAKGRIQVPLESLSCCSHVCAGPGDAITVDGIVLEGEGYVKDTAMTGELEPTLKRVGDVVFAGSYSVDGLFTIKPTGLKGQRRLDALLSTVESAQFVPSSLQSQADRIMQWFLPLVATASVGTFVYWFGQVPWANALFNSMAVLLVACPCALGLATPLAVWTGLWKLSTWGLVSRSGALIDGLAQMNTIVFDKTGTLSEEDLVLVDFLIEPRFLERAEWLKSVVCAMESKIDHPVARAFLSIKHKALELASLEHIVILPGQGVQASLVSGDVVFIGTLEDVEASEAKRVIGVKVNGELAARAYLEEKMRARVGETFVALQEMGIELMILTGDPFPKWPLVSGLPIESGLSPQDKFARVQALQKAGRRLLYVGDGVNDAPAMAHCEASIAMGGGAALTQSTASGVLMGNSLEVLPRAITLARRIRKSVRANMLFASSYNVIGMTLAAMGKLHPVVAVLLMFISSIFVSVRAAKAAELVNEKT